MLLLEVDDVGDERAEVPNVEGYAWNVSSAVKCGEAAWEATPSSILGQEGLRIRGRPQRMW